MRPRAGGRTLPEAYSVGSALFGKLGIVIFPFLVKLGLDGFLPLQRFKSPGIAAHCGSFPGALPAASNASTCS